MFYPLLFPYWLLNREAQQVGLFKGFTVGQLRGAARARGPAVFHLLAARAGFRDYLPVLGLTLAVEWLLVLALLMPIATTVVGFHASMRRGRLVALLVGLASTVLVTARLVRRRDPVVSFSTRERLSSHGERPHPRAGCQRGAAGGVVALAGAARGRGTGTAR